MRISDFEGSSEVCGWSEAFFLFLSISILRKPRNTAEVWKRTDIMKGVDSQESFKVLGSRTEVVCQIMTLVFSSHKER